MEVFIHEIKLNGDSEFINKFNNVSDLYTAYKEAKDSGKSKELVNELWGNFYSAKYCLEQGIG